MKPQPPESTKRFWRSLERLYRSPALSELDAGEFPLGAEQLPEGITRRGMLELLGASMALAGLASCRRPEQEIVPFVTAPESSIPGVSKRYATTIPWSWGGHGVVVESHEGRPTKVEGNELHPFSMGRASAWMQASILDLYDPDRSSRVMRRAERDAPLSASSWEDFLAFWEALAPEIEDKMGADLAVVSAPASSPTLFQQREYFLDRFPEARWVVHEPLGPQNRFEGLRQLTGRTFRPVLHLERARRIACFDADILLSEPEAVTQARGFARGRRIDGDDEMSRLYVVESTLSLTGANADHRLAVPSHRVGTVLAALAAELERLGIAVGLEGVAMPNVSDATRDKVGILARDLAAFRERSIVTVGYGQPAPVHALALAVNRALGAVGTTITFHGNDHLSWGSTSELAELVEAMRGGSIRTLVVLGGNPVYTAPADLSLASALKAVDNVVQLSTRLDETSEVATWHLPQTHVFEEWGDLRAADGTLSVVQPLIAPLYRGRSASELLASMTEDRYEEGYELVLATWREHILEGEDFQARWNQTLHDGRLEASALSTSEVPVEDGAARRAFDAIVSGSARDDSLELVFIPSSSVYDGRFSNNAWMQELPDPITKTTWGNAALVSPVTAGELGLATGDVVTLELGERRIDAPVMVLPGQATGSIALPLGYGRNRAGRVGDGVGVDAYRLRTRDALHAVTGLLVHRTGRQHDLAVTQEHWSMEGRELIREATLDDFRNEPETGSVHGAPALWEAPTLGAQNQWGMAIDLNSCTGCNACVTACQSENNVPVVGEEQVRRSREMHWIRIDRYFAGSPEGPQVSFQPVPCMHCETAPCEQVCPVGATMHDQEGLNVMVYNRCIGTRYCSNNCPYKVRRFNFFNFTFEYTEPVKMAMNPDVTVRSRGVMEKCSYCVQRLNEAKIGAEREGVDLRDGDVQTACQQTCPSEAIIFGDIADLESRVSREKKKSRNYVLLEEMNHKPRTSYLEKIRNPHPEWRSDANAV
jgi:MoCo/4Fe-4S cofactor protein with predicted Tat translocation signal